MATKKLITFPQVFSELYPAPELPASDHKAVVIPIRPDDGDAYSSRVDTPRKPKAKPLPPTVPPPYIPGKPRGTVGWRAKNR